MLVGHRTLIALFKQLIKTEKLASGYIFFGQPQIGKRTFAESLANYLEGRDFQPSSRILQETLLIKTEGESIGIDLARKIKVYLSGMPIASPRRTVIIDNAQDLTLQAENALLKISEEPPQHSLIILITTTPETLLSTLASRLQKIYFSPVPHEALEKLIQEKKISAKEKKELLRLVSGSAGKLIELLEKKDVLEDMAKKISHASAATRRKLINEYLEGEHNPLALVDALILYFFFASEKSISTILRALKARRELASLNVNPRLQLESIFY
jgi:DNA polymerase-3 subunit delta'